MYQCINVLIYHLLNKVILADLLFRPSFQLTTLNNTNTSIYTPNLPKITSIIYVKTSANDTQQQPKKFNSKVLST